MSDHRFVGTEFKGSLGVAITDDEQTFHDLAYCVERKWQLRIVAALNAARDIDLDTLRSISFASKLALPKSPYVLISGDVHNGLDFHGPFESADDAVAYGEHHANTLGHWVIAPTVRWVR